MEADLNNSLEFLQSKIDDNKKVLLDHTAKISEYIEKTEKLRQENTDLKERVRMLEKRINDNEQFFRRNDLEIHGIPEVRNETTLDVVKKVGLALDIEISDDMVDTCYRIGKRPQENGQRGILVKFVNRTTKEKMISRRRVKRTLSTLHLGMEMDTPVYINESLSLARRKIFAAARVKKKEKGYKYLWIKYGKILMRKKENDPIIILESLDDLNEL